MLLWGWWALAFLSPAGLNAPGLSPAGLDLAQSGPAHLVLGLAAIAVLAVAAIRLPVLVPAVASGVRAFARRARTATRPRLADPDAAGRPRSRAPSTLPAVV